MQPWDKLYQYLLFAAEPYEIIAFKVITQLILVQMDFFWASPVQEELGAKGLVHSAFFHMWTNTDMYRVQEAVTTTLYVTLSMPWDRCLLLQGQTEMKWSLPLQGHCSLNEDIIGQVSWFLVNIMSECSHCLWQWDRNSGYRFCTMFCPDFGLVDICLSTPSVGRWWSWWVVMAACHCYW